MRRLSLLIAVLFIVLLLGSDSPKEYRDRATFDPVEGTWRLTAYGNFGKERRPENPMVMTLYDGNSTCRWSDGRTLQENYRIDPTRKPPRIDLVVIGNRQTFRQIYQIDADTLRFASGWDLEQYPQGFEDDGVFVSIYKRVK